MEVVRELLKQGAKLESSHNYGWTPLNTASEKDPMEVVRELLKHGAKLESAYNNGCAPVNGAAEKATWKLSESR